MDGDYDEEEDVVEFDESVNDDESKGIYDDWCFGLTKNGEHSDEQRKTIHLTIAKCRQVVTMTKKSSVLGNYLDKLRNSLNTTRGLANDCPTRWNSTFHMIESFLASKNLLAKLFGEKNLLNIRKDLVDKLGSFELQRNDWLLLLDLHIVLKPFELATRLMSGKQYPTVGLCYYTIIKLKAFLTDHVNNAPSVKCLKLMLLNELRHYFFSDQDQLNILQVPDAIRNVSSLLDGSSQWFPWNHFPFSVETFLLCSYVMMNSD